jgi:PAS domain S-box-containing protein/diguanylate cyclase (GGDEF)-like protein
MAEDSDQDAELVLRELNRSGLKFESRRVQTEPDFRRALDEFRPQLILSDFVMPGFGGIAALNICREAGIDIPFIFVSGTIGEDVAVEAMKAGADDYVMKSNLIRLGPTVTRALREAENLRASESLKSAIIEASLDCIVTIDHEGTVVEFNPAAEGAFGIKCEDALGKPMVELIIPPRLRDAHRRGFARYLATGDGPILGKRIELEAIRADGTEFPVEIAITAIRSGRTPLFTGFIRDLTERKRAEEAQRADQARLRESEARHRAMFEQAAVGIVHSTLEGKVQMVNPKFCEMTGYSQAEAIGIRIQDLTHSEDIDRSVEGRAQVLSGVGTSYERELRLVRKDRSEAWAQVTTSLVHGADGQPSYFISVVNDISERKRAERELERFRMAMNISADSIFLTDPTTMRFVYVNDTACTRLGYPRERLLDMSAQAVLRAGRDDLSRGFDDVIAAGNHGLRQESPFARKDGSRGWTELHSRALSTESGTLIVTIARDITERKTAEEGLRESESRLKLFVVHAPAAIAMLDRDMRYVAVSHRWLTDYRVDNQEVVGRSHYDVFPEMPERWKEIHRRCLAGAVEKNDEDPFPRADGSLDWVRWEIRPWLAADGTVGGLMLFSELITDRIETANKIKRLNRVHAVLSGINALIVRVSDRDELFREACRIAVEQGGFKMAWIGIVDSAALKILPVAAAGAEPEFLALIKDRFSLREDDPLGNTRTARAVREKKAMVSNEIKEDSLIFFSKERQERGIRSMAILPLLASDNAIGVLALYAGEAGFFDDEELKLLRELAGDIAFAIDHIEKAARLDYLAYYDQLTGLANRTLFLERVNQSILAAGLADTKFALAILDIERLRTINDSLGRQAGDALIKLVAERLTLAGGAAGVSRISADHFALVLGTVKGRSEAGRIMTDALHNCFDAPFQLNDTEVRISAKAGVAQFPGDGTEAETLLRNAEAALRKGKDGGERITFHSAEMTARVAESLTLENKLRQALEREEFVLYYQPKVDLETRHIVGVEALIRWQSPERGLVPPLHFIPLLEETGLILQVGAWALKRATRDHALWLRQGVPAPRIAVNVSAIQLRQRDFVRVVTEAIAGGTDPTSIDVEITESLLMEDVAGNIEKLKALRELGMKISIDDFGTG